MESWREELYHHGIQGQKWGVQNGPPYPLDYNDHSAKEKRAMKKDAKSIQKKMNSLENLYAKSEYSRDENLRKTNKYALKAVKANKENRNSKKYDEKALKYLTKAITDEQFMSKSESETWKLIGTAMKNGYGLQSKAVIRDGRKWYQQANESGLIGAAVTQIRVSKGAQTNPNIITNQWKVTVGNKELNPKKGKSWVSSPPKSAVAIAVSKKANANKLQYAAKREEDRKS